MKMVRFEFTGSQTVCVLMGYIEGFETAHLLPLKERMYSLLSPFHFTSVMSLRELMVNTGTVISGSFALAILHPQQFDPNDIDFYVLPLGFGAVLKYVAQHGYIIDPYEHGTSKYVRQHIVVVRLIHPISQKSINVITGFKDHVVEIITQFHSTLVMNYLAWFGLVVLYPEWTLNKAGLIVTDTLTSEQCFTKYIGRGYTLHRDVHTLTHPLEVHRCGEDPYCAATMRSLHDEHSYVEQFDDGEFDFKEAEEDMSWTLSIPCSF